MLLIGGTSGPTELATLEIYTPATRRFRRADATLPRAANALAAVLEVYDPASDGWEVLGATLARSRHDLVALRMPHCRVLVAGGKQVVAGEGESSPTEVEVITVPHAGVAGDLCTRAHPGETPARGARRGAAR